MTPGLINAWSDLGRQFAVLAGMVTALMSLVAGCPLWVASIRGAAAILGVVLIVHLIGRLIVWSTVGDREERTARVAAASAQVRSANQERL